MQTDWYVHFHPDERLFVDRAWEWVERTAQQHEVRTTDFLDPRQCDIVAMLVNKHPDVHCRMEGGHPEAERKRVIIAPDYRPLEDMDADIKVLAIGSDDAKISDLDHGDYLGAILGLGIKREKIGDLHVTEEGCHGVVASEISDYLHMNLQQVHRIHVWTELLPLDQLRVVKQNLEEKTITSPSLRLDGIFGDVWNISRAKSLIPIKAGRCKVNWKPVEDPSHQLAEGDVVSVKGFGRFKILEVDGVTKKGRIRLTIGKYV